MNIYKISWLQSDQYGLSAVVIAENDGDALKECDLGEEESDITVKNIGICTLESVTSSVTVCKESL